MSIIKQIWVAQCDVCGKTENARIMVGAYNDEVHTLPVGWGYGYNENMHLCPECSKRIMKKVGEP